MRAPPNWMTWLLCASVAACTDAGARPPVRAPVTPGPRADSTPPTQYYLRVPHAGQRGRVELDEGRIGFVTRGDRWVLDARGAVITRAHADAFVESVTPIAEEGATSFLFSTRDGLYASKTFDGPLTRLLSEPPAYVSGGPGFAFVRTVDGRTLTLPVPSGTRPSFPLGTQSVGSSSSGAIGAVVDGGRALLSTDRGAHFVDHSAVVGEATDVVVRGGALYFTNATGEAFAVEGDRLVSALLPVEPAPKGDPVWSRGESPVEVAVARGAEIEGRRAVFAEAGAVYTVSLESGEIVAVERGVLPPVGQCTSLALRHTTLFLCGRSVFARGPDGKIAIEQAMVTDGSFVKGVGDALLYTAGCGAVTKPGLACVRKADGSWSELDRSAELSDAPAAHPLQIRAWIPDGEGAQMVVEGEGGGLWSATNGMKTALKPDELARLAQLFDPLPSGGLVDRYGVDADGRVVGVGRDGVGFRVLESGRRVELSSFRFPSPRVAGRRVLAREASSNTYWQSQDYGFTFTEVDGPPDPPNQREDVNACSDAGCSFSQWLRAGWEPRPPVSRPSEALAAQRASRPEPALPSLRCTVIGAQTRKAAPSVQERLGFGAENLKAGEQAYVALYPFGGTVAGSFLESTHLRAIVTGKQPLLTDDGSAAQRAATRRIRAVAPFDTKGAVFETTQKLSELFDVARSSGGVGPDLATFDERGQSIAVVGAAPSLILGGQSGPSLWLREKERPFAFSFPDSSPPPIVAAAELKKDELAVLVARDDGALVVRLVGPGRSNDLFHVPPNLGNVAFSPTDTLAIGPGAELGVLRVRTDGPPTKEDPAILIRPGKPNLALAPWSTLAADGSAACATAPGFRAVISTKTPWIDALSRTTDGVAERPALLLVRWSAERVCLEAAEIPYLSQTLPSTNSADSVLVVRFGKDTPAPGAQILIAEGAELREPRSCELVP